VPPSGNYARGKRVAKGMRELIAPTIEVLQFSDSPAEDKNAAFKIAGLRHVPLAALQADYTTCPCVWKGRYGSGVTAGADRVAMRPTALPCTANAVASVISRSRFIDRLPRPGVQGDGPSIHLAFGRKSSDLFCSARGGSWPISECARKLAKNRR
jgi:hypothetical protein